MNKKAFTLVELLVTLCILGTFILILLPAILAAFSAESHNSPNNHVDTYKCINTFQTQMGDSATILKASLKPVNGGQASVFICQENVFAQFEIGKYYNVQWYSMFGNKYAIEASEAEKFQAENEAIDSQTK